MTLVEWYQKCVDWFTEHNVPVFIHGSTLLGAVRDNRVLDRIPFDKEINFGIRAEDLTLQTLSDMQRDFPYFLPTGEKQQNALIYFGPEPLIRCTSMNKDHWAMEPGLALLAVFWRGDTKWVEYMGINNALWWPKTQLDTFGRVTLAGRTVSTPSDIHGWLSHYFGPDYMTENVGWHWAHHSHNLVKYSDIAREENIEHNLQF